MKSSRTKSTSPAPLHQLKISLKWSRPAIWRRVVVPSDLPLDRLHDVIQIAMGWTNSHLHQFVGAGGVYRSHSEDLWELDDDDANDEEDHAVADLVRRPKAKFVYEYDFGDGWLHDVTLEKILPPDPAFKHPVCVAGKNACPPEDCGGMPGYLNLLRTLANPKEPEHESMKEWLGGEWDASAFELDKINRKLKRVKR